MSKQYIMDDYFKSRLHRLYHDEMGHVEDDLVILRNTIDGIYKRQSLNQAGFARNTIKDLKLQIIKRERYLNVLRAMDKGVDLMVVGPILDADEQKEVVHDGEDD